MGLKGILSNKQTTTMDRTKDKGVPPAPSSFALRHSTSDLESFSGGLGWDWGCGSGLGSGLRRLSEGFLRRARIRVSVKVRARSKGRERGEGVAIEGGDYLKREIEGRGEVRD